MDAVSKALKGSNDLDYVVRGGRSYLSKIPSQQLQVLSAVLPEYFQTGDWNISSAHAPDVVALIAAAFKKAKKDLQIVDTSTPAMRRTSLVSEGTEVASVIDIAQSKFGTEDAACVGAHVVKDGIVYSSLCDCLSQLKRALASDTFAKHEKTAARLHALANLYKAGTIKAPASKRLTQIIDGLA